MAERGRCPSCGSELPAYAPQGLCPACLLRQGLETEAPALPPQGEPTAMGVPMKETVPVPGAGTTASLTPRPTGMPLDPTATNPVTPGSGSNGDGAPPE